MYYNGKGVIFVWEEAVYEKGFKIIFSYSCARYGAVM